MFRVSKSRQHMLRRLFWVIAGLALVPVFVRAQTPNILFVGDSFTYGHDEPVLSYENGSVDDLNGTGYGGVPGIFKQMAAQTNFSCNVEIEAVASYTLMDHYLNKASVIVGNGPLNIVVFQGNSTEALPAAFGGAPNNFDNYAQYLRNLVLSNNSSAKQYLFETWASPSGVESQGYPSGLTGLQDMQSDVQAAYAYADAIDGFNGVAPVGDAFLRAIDRGYATSDPTIDSIPGFDLWNDSDLFHASVYGSYLAAAVLYAEITGKNPMLLPYSGSAAQSFGISQANALTLETVAEETVPEPDCESLVFLGGTVVLGLRLRRTRLDQSRVV